MNENSSSELAVHPEQSPNPTNQVSLNFSKAITYSLSSQKPVCALCYWSHCID